MEAVIKKKSLNTMQSGKNNPTWELSFKNSKPIFMADVDSWVAGGNTQAETKITFPSKEAAVEFAKKQGYNYKIINAEKINIVKPKTYVDTIIKNPKI